MTISGRGSDTGQDDVLLEAGRRLFAKPWRFVLAAPALAALPPVEGIEIAFAGRSNVGKSSLLNAVTGRKALARTSNTPGRTQALNFYAADAGISIVDLPGYGFAQAPKKQVALWTRLTFDYLRGRPNLRRVYLLVDARHGSMARDRAALDLLDTTAVSYQVVLTKCDKPKPDDLVAMIDATRAAVAKRPAAYPDVIATSATAGTGIDQVRAAVATLREA